MLLMLKNTSVVMFKMEIFIKILINTIIAGVIYLGFSHLFGSHFGVGWFAGIIFAFVSQTVYNLKY